MSVRRPFAGVWLAVSMFLFCTLFVSEVTAVENEKGTEYSQPSAQGEALASDAPEEESASEGEFWGQPTELLIEEGLGIIAERHAMISNGIIDSAEWVDSFFWDRRIEPPPQQTRIDLAFSLLAGDHDSAEFDGSAHLRLSLPMLSKRLQLQISDNRDDEPDINAIRDPWPPRDNATKGVLAGLRYFFTQKAKRNSSIKASFRLRDGSPVLLLEPRYRQDFPFDAWLFRFTQRGIGYSNGELQFRTILNLERPLTGWPPRFLFASVAEGTWFRDRSGYYYHIDFKLQQILSARRNIEYALVNEFQTVPDHQLEVARVRVSYRQNVRWNWLFFEISPQVTFARAQDWKPDPSVLLNMEVIFGACE